VNTDKFQSRKYRLSLYSLLLVLGGWIASGYNPNLRDLYAELITGISAIQMLYFSGNVGNKFVLSRGESHGTK
jgi:hypothetical protein